MSSSARDSASSPTSPAPAQRPARARFAIFAVAGLAALAWVIQFGFHRWRYEGTDDAFVAGHVHLISAQVNGRVVAVAARENQPVRDGDLLARLDPLEFDIGTARAAASLAQAEAAGAVIRASAVQAEAHVLQARARAMQAEALVKQARAQLALAQLTLDRDIRMAQEHALTPADLDAARAGFDASSAAVNAAVANHEGVAAEVTAAEEERKAVVARQQEAAAAVNLARAAVQDAARRHSYVDIVAPADGRIGNKNIEIGNRIEVGQTLMAVVEPEVWVEANFKETQLARMRPGQAAEVRIDAIPGHVFRAQIESVAPASGAQFALLPADNATGNFTKVVQRVPVRVAFAPDALRGFADRVRPGLSVTVDARVR